MTRNHQPTGHVTVCAYCGKRTYTSRALAKRARRLIPDNRGMRPYRCPHNPSAIHLGHLPVNVREGRITAPEIYGKEASRA